MIDPEEPPSGRCLLSLGVALITTCIALTIVSLSVVAGYRDELKEIQTEDAQSLQEEAAFQYERGLEDETAGRFELAQGRYGWIATRLPNYRDVPQRLAVLDEALSITPTPTPTDTPEATLEPTDTPMPEATATTEQPPIVTYYSNAERALSFRRFEDTIEWLDAVIATDPSYRRAEVDQMLFEALTEQARIYFKGTNPVDEAGTSGYPGNQLARGVQLTNRATQLQLQNPSVGSLGDLGFEAYYADQIMLALGYMEGGQYGAALPILERLYTESSVWSYRGLTIEGLLQRARNGGP
jgi:tetratricopeptide (TPR) repeat protein